RLRQAPPRPLNPSRSGLPRTSAQGPDTARLLTAPRVRASPCQDVGPMLELQHTPPAPPRRRRAWLRGPWGVLIAAGLMSTVLFGSALLIQGRVQHASEWAARGEAEAFVVSIRDAVRQQPDRAQE